MSKTRDSMPATHHHTHRATPEHCGNSDKTSLFSGKVFLFGRLEVSSLLLADKSVLSSNAGTDLSNTVLLKFCS